MSYQNHLIIAGLKRRELEWGTMFGWGGRELPCAGSRISTEKKLGEGGNSLSADVVICVRTELFKTSSRPKEQDQCRFQPGPKQPWRELRIDSVITPPGAAYLEFHCNDRHQGA